MKDKIIDDVHGPVRSEMQRKKKLVIFFIFSFFHFETFFYRPFFCSKTGGCFPLLLLCPPGTLLLCQDLPVQEDSEEARDERGGAGEKASELIKELKRSKVIQ